MQGCYLLHFNVPISSEHTCQHYLGSAEDVAGRVRLHLSGQAARLTQVAKERGIDFVIARVWESDDCRRLEKELKAKKNGPKLCPICRGETGSGVILEDLEV